MKRLQNRLILAIALTVGSVVGVFRGNEAKQKWVFRVKSRFEERKQAQHRKMLQNGGVMLDDIEIAAYHNS